MTKRGFLPFNFDLMDLTLPLVESVKSENHDGEAHVAWRPCLH